MNLHLTLNFNGAVSTVDYPNSTGTFTFNTVTGLPTLFNISRDGKIVAQYQAATVLSWDNSDPAA